MIQILNAGAGPVSEGVTTPIDYIKLLELINLSHGPLQAPAVKLGRMNISSLSFKDAMLC